MASRRTCSRACSGCAAAARKCRCWWRGWACRCCCCRSRGGDAKGEAWRAVLLLVAHRYPKVREGDGRRAIRPPAHLRRRGAAAAARRRRDVPRRRRQRGGRGGGRSGGRARGAERAAARDAVAGQRRRARQARARGDARDAGAPAAAAGGGAGGAREAAGAGGGDVRESGGRGGVLSCGRSPTAEDVTRNFTTYFTARDTEVTEDPTHKYVEHRPRRRKTRRGRGGAPAIGAIGGASGARTGPRRSTRAGGRPRPGGRRRSRAT